MHDAAAVLPRTRPDVDDVVRRLDGRAVVLDDDQRVAQVAQPLERRDEPLVVTLVQTDRRLIEHVEHPDEAGTDLRREADALRLTAGQRRRGAVELEVLEPDIEQEAQACPDFLEYAPGDEELAARELEVGDERVRLRDRQARELRDRQVTDGDGEHDRLQPQPLAVGAGDLAHVLLDVLTLMLGLRLLVPTQERRDHTLDVGEVGACAAVPVAVPDVDAIVEPVEHRVLRLLRQVLPWGRRVGAHVRHDRAQQLAVVAGLHARRPREDDPLLDRARRVADDELRLDGQLRPEPGARLARAVRRVEREAARRELLERQTAVHAGEMLGVGVLLTRRALRRVTRWQHVDGHEPVREAQCRLDGVGEPPHPLAVRDEPVDHHVDVVLARLRELRHLLDRVHRPVDTDPRVAVGRELLEQGRVLALPTAHDRGEDLEAGAGRELGDTVDDLLGGLARDGCPALRTVRVTDAGIEEPQVVVDLGDGPDRRARVARGRLLVDRDRGREPLDEVDVRLVHLAEELARVGGQGLDVAALPLGVDRVEREARLPRAGEPGEDRQPIARDPEVDVLEVVLPGPTHGEMLMGRTALRHRTASSTLPSLRPHPGVPAAPDDRRGTDDGAPRAAPPRGHGPAHRGGRRCRRGA